MTTATQQQTFTLPVTPSTLEAWRDDEFASWEDHGGSPNVNHPPAHYPDGTLHVYEILERYRTKVRADDVAELRALIRSADYHGNGGWDDRYAYRAALSRVSDRLERLLADAPPADPLAQLSDELLDFAGMLASNRWGGIDGHYPDGQTIRVVPDDPDDWSAGVMVHALTRNGVLMRSLTYTGPFSAKRVRLLMEALSPLSPEAK